MFEFDCSIKKRKYGAEFGINLKFKALSLIKEAFIKIPSIYKFEGGLWLFKSSIDAI